MILFANVFGHIFLCWEKNITIILLSQHVKWLIVAKIGFTILEHHQLRTTIRTWTRNLQMGIVKQPSHLVQRIHNITSANASYNKHVVHGNFVKFAKLTIKHDVRKWEHLIVGCSQTFSHPTLYQPKCALTS